MYQVIRAAAEKKGMTDVQVARAARINPSLLTRIKQTGGNLSFANAAKVAAVLGLDMADLIDARRKK